MRYTCTCLHTDGNGLTVLAPESKIIELWHAMVAVFPILLVLASPRCEASPAKF
jgi:hypothetical protein